MSAADASSRAASTSPRHPRVVRSYEQQAQCNALRRTIHIARQAIPDEDRDQLQQLEQLAQTLGGKSSNIVQQNIKRWEAREQQLKTKDDELVRYIQTENKRRHDLVRDARRERQTAIEERTERLTTRTQASNDNVRAMEATRSLRLTELGRKRAKRLMEIETNKHKELQRHLESRVTQNEIREKKVAAVSMRFDEKAEQLEREMAEREEVMEKRRERVMEMRKARALQIEKQRREVIARGGEVISAEEKQEALEEQLASRTHRLAQFKAHRDDEIRQRSRAYDDKLQKIAQMRNDEMQRKLRHLRDFEKKRNQIDKRVTGALSSKRKTHEDRARAKEAERLRRYAHAREMIEGEETGAFPPSPFHRFVLSCYPTRVAASKSEDA
ncbi:Myosin heavy chain [Diplonema papillatum]|nr:Myosin heavy chain [Diplonema papillatum]